ncbi:hypothetical protein GEMRC1_008517 [Eukaryota sp. GEM-RC1]
MSKRLSFEEKLERVLQFFHDNQRIFNMKELEKKIPKATGVTLQTVKEVVQSLVDDRLVDTDKIGSGNFYWAFLSQAKLSRTSVLNKLQTQLSTLNAQVKSLEKKLASLESLRCIDGRHFLMEEYLSLRTREKELSSQLSQYNSLDPEVIDQINSETAEFVEAANRWGENIYTIRKHCIKEFRFNPSDFDAQFEINEELMNDLELK